MSSSSWIGRLVAPLITFLVLFLAHGSAERIHSWLPLSFGANVDTARAALGIGLWLAAAWLASRLINGVIISSWVRRRTGAAPPGILANTLSALIFLVAIVCIMRFVFGKSVTGLLATSGIMTLVIGFAIRDMIADFFSGLAMNLEQPYRIGDWIELEPGLVGRVTEMNWRATRFTTQEQRTVVVPNSNLSGRQFINFSMPQRAYRESIELVLDFTIEPSRAENMLLAAVLATPGLHNDREHQVRIKDFSDRGVIYQVRFWIEDYKDRATLRHKVGANILRHLTQAGISIPHQQHEMFLARSKRTRQDRRIEANRLMSRIGWLEALTPDELDRLGEVAVAREYSAGDEIMREGEEGDTLYLLVEGTLQASTNDASGQNKEVGVIQPGEAFGEMSLLTGAPRAATIRARTRVFAFEVKREDFEPILRARPEIATSLGSLMAKRASSLQRTAAMRDQPEQDDAMTRARQIAKRISAFFGLGEPAGT